mgnify:CR=1 FL=1
MSRSLLIFLHYVPFPIPGPIKVVKKRHIGYNTSQDKDDVRFYVETMLYNRHCGYYFPDKHLKYL